MRSPILYNLYINAFIKSISEAAERCKLGSFSTNIACYADDMIIMAPTFSALQQLVQKACNGLKAHSLKMNFDKSKYIVFKKRQKVGLMDVIEVSGSALKKVDQIKYIGIILTENSSIAGDVDRCFDFFLSQFNGMYHNFNFLDINALHFLLI